jgi:hypothetical protein
MDDEHQQPRADGAPQQLRDGAPRGADAGAGHSHHGHGLRPKFTVFGQ